MQTFSHAQIEQFKRKAKLNKQVSAIPHSQALDLVAQDNGYGNWSLLMKHSSMHGSPGPKRARPKFRFTRTPELMRLALRKVPEPSGIDAPRRVDFARQKIDDISQAFGSAPNVVEFAIDYMTCLLTVPRFRLDSASTAYWEMRSWLPYYVHPVEVDVFLLVNRHYKPVGQVGNEWAKYEEFPHLQTRITGDSLRRFTAP
ncbi:MAG: hypothetical protein Q8K34_05150, partial [Hydrogenophaga sp.]|nr:hypothetical protein [Hydrogenophaga sp.]